MYFVVNPSLDPYFNIAAEEHLLKYLDREIVSLYCNSSSVIVGKHQNTLAEINAPYVLKNNIPVVRRISGGGTVFHDLGNINFTFIRRIDPKKMVNFQVHTQPVVDFLQSKGVDAHIGGKNDIRVEGIKISGNAQHIFRDKVLHHGTLLYNTNLKALTEALEVNNNRMFADKAIKSIRSNVINIASLLNYQLPLDTFTSELKNHLFACFPQMEEYHLSDQDIELIEKLKKEKYNRWEWNFGYSPEYVYRNCSLIKECPISIELKVKNGVCNSVLITVNNKILYSNHPLIIGLVGLQYKPDSIDNLLYEHNFLNYRDMGEKWDLLGLFF